MKLSERGYQLVKKWEGYHKRLNDGTGRCRAYWDSIGRCWTIGWGCTRGVTSGMIWTREEAQAALERELAIHEAAVNQYVSVPITQQHFDALVVFAYNVGNGNPKDPSAPIGFTTSTLLRKLNRGDYDGAEAQFMLWVKGGRPRKTVPGLVNRRRDEKLLFAEGTLEMEQRDESMWWETSDDVVSVGEPLGQRPSPASEPISAGAAAAGSGAAAGAAAVASHAPSGSWDTVLSTVQAFVGFASSSPGVIITIGGIGLLAFLMTFQFGSKEAEQ